MHRRGHRGITLLASAPIVYAGLQLNLPLLALCSVLGIAAIEPLPDWDFWLPGLRHRGVSHSVLAALAVGAILGGSGWLIGGYTTAILRAVPTWSSAVLDLVASVGLPAPLTEAIHASTQTLERHIAAATQRPIDRYAVALTGSAIGVYAILVHLLGDIMTTRGIRPFLPFSHRRIAPSPLRASNPTVNEGLFILGVLGMGLALGLAIPSVEVMGL